MANCLIAFYLLLIFADTFCLLIILDLILLVIITIIIIVIIILFIIIITLITGCLAEGGCIVGGCLMEVQPQVISILYLCFARFKFCKSSFVVISFALITLPY